jgi:uncharacterized protein YkwD
MGFAAAPAEGEGEGMVTETLPGPVMRRLVRITTALTCAFVLSGLATPGSAGASVNPRQRLLGLINEVRERRGVGPVRLAARASRLAERNSERMAREGEVSPSGINYRYDEWGENVSCGRSIRQAHAKLMEAAEARRNIIRARFRRVGLGIAITRPKRRVCRKAQFWVTEVFFSN